MMEHADRRGNGEAGGVNYCAQSRALPHSARVASRHELPSPKGEGKFMNYRRLKFGLRGAPGATIGASPLWRNEMRPRPRS
jgi:hypothetical protein